MYAAWRASARAWLCSLVSYKDASSLPCTFRTIYSSTRPRRPFSSTRSCLRLLRDFAQRAGSITPLQLEVLCRCSTHTHARRRRLPRCRFAPPRPNRHLLCGAAAAPSSPQSNISTLASFASRRHFLDGPRLGPPRVSSGSLPSTPFCLLQASRTLTQASDLRIAAFSTDTNGPASARGRGSHKKGHHRLQPCTGSATVPARAPWASRAQARRERTSARAQIRCQPRTRLGDSKRDAPARGPVHRS